MNLFKNKYLQTSVTSLAFAVLAVVGFASQASAHGSTVLAAGPSSSSTFTVKKDDCKAEKGEKLNKDNCGIINIIVVLTNILSAIVGVVLVLVIIVGGIQYSSSADNPSAVAEARKKIINAVVALVLYIFGYALLQYLIPGGIL